MGGWDRQRTRQGYGKVVAVKKPGYQLIDFLPWGQCRDDLNSLQWFDLAKEQAGAIDSVRQCRTFDLIRWVMSFRPGSFQRVDLYISVSCCNDVHCY